ncbi:MAG: hypothetical protein Q8Q20_00415 [bacterium]|nr:hypothetical protein [bacterium]
MIRTILIIAVIVLGFGLLYWMNSQTDPPVDVEYVQGFEGRALGVSDIAGVSEMPYSSGVIMAFRAEDWQILLGRLNLQTEGFNYERAGLLLTEAHINDFDVAEGGLSQDGAYAVNVTPGEYVVCAANVGDSHPQPESYPRLTYGCAEAISVEGERGHVDIYFDGS